MNEIGDEMSKDVGTWLPAFTDLLQHCHKLREERGFLESKQTLEKYTLKIHNTLIRLSFMTPLVVWLVSVSDSGQLSANVKMIF